MTDPTEKLIDYYFERKRAGFSEIEIRKSLEQQPLLDEERINLILKVVSLKEKLYLRESLRKRNAKILNFTGTGLLVISVLSGLLLEGDFSLILRSAVLLGVGLVLAGLLVARSKVS